MVSKDVVHKSRVVPSVSSAVELLCQELFNDVQGCGFDEDDAFAIHLAIEEALRNAVEHGNDCDESKQVTVECTITSDKFDISISDEGSGFKPDVLPDPRSQENLYKCSGRGVLLMRAYMDVVDYNDRGNCVHMIKYRTGLEIDEVKE